MSKERELLERALVALEYAYKGHRVAEEIRDYLAAEPEAETIETLKAENFKLASGQCTEGGPWGDEGGTPYCKYARPEPEAKSVAWQGLKMHEVALLWSEALDPAYFARAIEQALKEKNTRPETEAEPFAWVDEERLKARQKGFSAIAVWFNPDEGDIPLYLHPPKPSPARKPMTEEEIRELGESFRNNRNPEKFIDFARAIEKHHGIPTVEMQSKCRGDKDAI